MTYDSERRLRSRRLEDLERDNLFALSLDILLVCGFDGVFRQVNPAMEHLLGYTTLELTSRPFIEYVIPEDRPATQEQFAHCMGGDRVVTFENRFRHADGSSRWLQWNGTPDLERQVIYASARDITDRKRVEAEVARLAAIVESSEDAIIGVSLHGVIETWNAAAEEMFGWRAADVQDKPLAILIPPGHADHLMQTLDQIRHGRRVSHYETIRRRREGDIINVSLSVSPVRDMAGQVSGASVIMRDITERKKAEAERMNLLQQLEHTLARSKRATGTIQICPVCHRVHAGNGHWISIARYLEDFTDARPVESRCPDHGQAAGP